MTEEVASRNARLESELKDWKDYLDWKELLAKKRVRGLKYIAIRFNLMDSEMSFLVVSEGKEPFKHFRHLLSNDEISAFPNN